MNDICADKNEVSVPLRQSKDVLMRLEKDGMMKLK